MRIVFFLMMMILSRLSAQDSLQDFFERRLALEPPTEQEGLAVAQTVKNFLEKVSMRKLTEAYFLETSPQFQSATSFDYFQLFVKDLVDIEIQHTFSMDNVSFKNNDKNKATYSLLLKGKKKGQKLYVEFDLENQNNGAWKIMTIKIYDMQSKV